ncbi:MAG TPA: helix-turn-helix domain-containing protein [Phycisphaerae bacterium]|nr:helix-turn-helix domain-containing protein [Phycisphaerae bacterium]
METCGLNTAAAGANSRLAPAALDDLFRDVEFDGELLDRPRGIERCLRTDAFLQNIVQVRGAIRLSRNEYRFLSVLVQNEGEIVTAEHLMQRVFGADAKRSSHYARMYISLMRRRLETDPRRPRHIITEHRRGYRFVR